MNKKNIREIIKMLANDVSCKLIGEKFGCHRTTIYRIRKRYEENIELLSEIDTISDTILGNIIFKFETKASEQVDLGYIENELAKPHVTLKILYDELKNKYGDEAISQTAFYNYYKTNKVYKPTMLMVRQPGDIMEVDWAGDKVQYLSDGIVRYASLLVFILPYSGMGYFELFPNEKLDSWLEGHVNAFNFFEGVTRIIRPDNLKTAIIKPDKINPSINSKYKELCKHYNIIISPARPRAPQDKGTVENFIRIIYNNFYAIIRDQKSCSLNQLNQIGFQCLDKIMKMKRQNNNKTREEVFQEEKMFLNPLPENRNFLYNSKIVKVEKSYHFRFENNYYSVPFQYCTKEVKIKYNSKTIQVLYDGLEIANHIRHYGEQNYITNKDHMPNEHKFATELTPEKIYKEAKVFGPSTVEICKQILLIQNQSPQAYNLCRAIFKLSKKYTNEHLERTSRYFLKNGVTINYEKFLQVIELFT